MRGTWLLLLGLACAGVGFAAEGESAPSQGPDARPGRRPTAERSHGLGASGRLQGPLRATRRPGWRRDQLDCSAWAQDLAGEERAVAEILATGRIPGWGDEPEQTLSEVQLELLLDACACRPGLGPRVRALAPERPTFLGSFHLQVVALDLRGALAALEGEAVEGGSENSAAQDDGRLVRRGLQRLLHAEADEEQRKVLLAGIRSLQGAPRRWLLEALADRGQPVDGDLLAQVVAEGSAPAETVVPSLQRCERGLDLELRRAAVLALEALADSSSPRSAELALAGLARLRAGEVVAARALESPDARVRAAGQRWCLTVGAPATPAGLEAWLKAEQEWLERLAEVRDLLRSAEASRQLAGLGVVAARAWNQEAWGTLVAGHLQPADPRVARRQMEVLVRLEASARVEVAQGILHRGPAALVPLALEVLQGAGLGTSPAERS